MEYGVKAIIKAFSYYINIINKKTWSGYYFKNMIECRMNRRNLKTSRENQTAYSENEEPLVSVLIPTYNRAKILVERTIPSVLKQTYQNFEIIIVGDHCADDQVEILNNLNDKRIKFCNLPNRGNYPKILVIGGWLLARYLEMQL